MSSKRQKQDVVNGGQDWIEAEKQYLRDHYASGDVRQIAKRLGRTELAVRHFVSRHNLTKQKPWGDDEIQIIRDSWPLGGLAVVRPLLLDRTDSAIKGYARRLGLKLNNPAKWPYEQEQILSDAYGLLTVGEIAAMVGRSEKVVREKAAALGLRKRRASK